MAYDEALAERIREVLADSADVTERKMFGGLAFLVRGHMVCGVTHDDSCSAWAPRGVRRAHPAVRATDGLHRLSHDQHGLRRAQRHTG